MRCKHRHIGLSVLLVSGLGQTPLTLAAPGDIDNDGIDDLLESVVDLNDDGIVDVSYVSTPIFSDDFGTGERTGSDFCELNPAGSGDIRDGQYAVIQPIELTSNWMNFDGEFDIDRTAGDTNGRVLAANPDSTGPDLYRRAATGMRAGANYLFTAFILNTNRHATVAPVVNYVVENAAGQELGNFSTGELLNDKTEHFWVKNALLYPARSNTDVVLSLQNAAPGGSGNDLAIDDIEFAEIFRDTDGDGVADMHDTDSDNDGINDTVETGQDSDGDGRINAADLDADNDGILDSIEGARDRDNDGVPNFLDLDSDNDGLTDAFEAGALDQNRDGRIDNFTDNDLNGLDDGIAAAPLTPTDTDNDGIADPYDIDSDNDGILDIIETRGPTYDTDYDGRIDSFADANGDGLDDNVELSPSRVPDSDGDSTPDYQSVDADGDGLYDIVESGLVASDDDGILDDFADADGDGIADSVDVNFVGGGDADGDGIADVADADQTGGPDSDHDSIDNEHDADANGDGASDWLTQGDAPQLQDSNSDGIPDYMQSDDGDGTGDSTGVIGDSGSTNTDSTGKRKSGGGCVLQPHDMRLDPLWLLALSGAILVLYRRKRHLPACSRS